MKKVANFLGHIWHVVSHLLNQAGDEVQKVVLPMAVQVVSALEGLMKADSGDLVGTIISKITHGAIPGNVIEDKIRNVLPLILIKTTIVDAELHHKNADGTLDFSAIAKDANPIIQKALDKMNSADHDGLNALRHVIAVMFAQFASDGKLTWSDAAKYMEGFLKEIYLKEPPVNVQDSINQLAHATGSQGVPTQGQAGESTIGDANALLNPLHTAEQHVAPLQNLDPKTLNA